MYQKLLMTIRHCNVTKSQSKIRRLRICALKILDVTFTLNMKSSIEEDCELYSLFMQRLQSHVSHPFESFQFWFNTMIPKCTNVYIGAQDNNISA